MRSRRPRSWSGDFSSGQQIHLVRGFLGRIVGAEVAAIDVDRHERLGLVDDDRATLAQRHFALVNASDFLVQTILVE